MSLQLRRDLFAALERDPAARSAVEVALTYPGVHALWAHRVANALWRKNHRLAARVIASAAQRRTGIDIHPAAKLGPGLFIDHGTGVVIGETAEVGENVTIYHGVTLGGITLDEGKRHPTIGDRVTIGAGAKVLGPITIGSDSRIGANSVVVRSVSPDSVVVGVPGQVIATEGEHPAQTMNDSSLPDVIATTLSRLADRVESLEAQLEFTPRHTHPMPVPGGVWAGEDFSI